MTTSAKCSPPARRSRSRRSSTGGSSDSSARRAILASSSDDRSMSTSTFRPASRKAAATTRPETKSAAIESPGREAGRRGDQAGENGEGAREVAPEVERVGEERVAAIQPRPAQRHQRPRRVDGEDEPDRRERPPRRIDLELDDAGEPQDRGDGDPEADEDEEPGLGERGEVLGLRVPVRVAAIRRTNRDRHGEEREQRGGEVGARVRSLGEQPETRARQPDDELDRDEETRGPDRDERGAALRRHGRKATASAGGGVERPRSGTPLSSCSPRSSNAIPEPATRSRTVRVTRTSPGSASAETRAPMCTAIPATPPGRRVISPAWSPHRTSRPLRRASSRILLAQRMARVGPSKVARMPSPAVSSSLPSNAASAVRTTCSNRSRATRQVRSPSSAANAVEPTTSTKRTVASTRSQSPAPLDDPVMNSSIVATRSGSGTGQWSALSRSM